MKNFMFTAILDRGRLYINFHDGTPVSSTPVTCPDDVDIALCGIAHAMAYPGSTVKRQSMRDIMERRIAMEKNARKEGNSNDMEKDNTGNMPPAHVLGINPDATRSIMWMASRAKKIGHGLANDAYSGCLPESITDPVMKEIFLVENNPSRLLEVFHDIAYDVRKHSRGLYVIALHRNGVHGNSHFNSTVREWYKNNNIAVMSHFYRRIFIVRSEHGKYGEIDDQVMLEILDATGALPETDLDAYEDVQKQKARDKTYG